VRVGKGDCEMILSVDFTTITCCHAGCGIVWGVPNTWERKRLEDKKLFYCPNGHAQGFFGESEADKLRRELDRLKQQMAHRDDMIRERARIIKHAENSATAYKGHVTRIKNRVASGVCPCCNRSFQNLHQHMQNKHPDYRKEKVEA